MNEPIALISATRIKDLAWGRLIKESHPEDRGDDDPPDLSQSEDCEWDFRRSFPEENIYKKKTCFPIYYLNEHILCL